MPYIGGLDDFISPLTSLHLNFELVAGNGSPELVRFASPQALTDRLAPEGCEKVCGKFKEIRSVDRPH